MKEKNNVDSPSSAIAKSLFEGVPLTKEELRGGIRRDVYGSYLLLAEVLSSKEVLDAVTDVYWSRYQRMLKEKEESQKQTELELQAQQDVRS